MLVDLGLTCAIVAFGTVKAAVAVYQSIKYTLETDVNEKDIEIREDWRIYYRGEACVGIFLLTFQIAYVEMMIKYNGLTPEKSLSPHGQSIPLVISVIVLVDGMLKLLSTLAALVAD